MCKSLKFFASLVFLLYLVIFCIAQKLFAEDDALLSTKLCKEKRWKEAIAECEKEIKTKGDIQSYINLAFSYLEINEYNKAYLSTQEGRRVLQQQYNPRLLEMQAIACYNLGRNIEALNLLQTYLRITSQEKDISHIYYYMGELYSRLSQYNHADMAFTVAISLRPHEASWWARLGYVREMANPNRYDSQYALQAYKKALSLDKNYTDAVIGMKRVLQLLK